MNDLDAVLADLRRAVHADPARRRRPRRMVVLVLLPIALAVGASAYALTGTTAERVADDVLCHSDPNLLSRWTGIMAADGRDPVAICAALPDWHGSPPRLVACANEHFGEVDVFPGDPGLCIRLGLEPLPADYGAEASRFAAMRDAVVARVEAKPCTTEEGGRQIAREELDAHGFTDWTIETLRFSPATPCASLWFDSKRGVLGLTGGEPPRS